MNEVPVIAFKLNINDSFFFFMQMLMNVNEAPAEMAGSAQIWLRTIPVNARGNIWEETASTVSTSSCFFLFLWILPSLFHFSSLSPSRGLYIK